MKMWKADIFGMRASITPVEVHILGGGLVKIEKGDNQIEIVCRESEDHFFSTTWEGARDFLREKIQEQAAALGDRLHRLTRQYELVESWKTPADAKEGGL